MDHDFKCNLSRLKFELFVQQILNNLLCFCFVSLKNCTNYLRCMVKNFCLLFKTKTHIASLAKKLQNENVTFHYSIYLGIYLGTNNLLVIFLITSYKHIVYHQRQVRTHGWCNFTILPARLNNIFLSQTRHHQYLYIGTCM